MPKLRRPVTLAASLSLLLLADATTTPAPVNPSGASEVGTPLTAGKATGASSDSIISLKQWPSESGGNDHWYGILAVLHDWIEADSIAKTLTLDTIPGYLATIQSASENYFVFDSVLLGVDPPSVEKQFLLGGVRIGGAWQWRTGEAPCYLNWASGEPNNLVLEKVISLWGPSRIPQPIPPGSWNNTRDDAQGTSFRFWAVVEWGDPDFGMGPTCGDGLAECEEECDDGNLVNGDGCEANCEITCAPGDVNGSQTATAADIFCMLAWIFKGSGGFGCAIQPCFYAMDLNCNGIVTTADVITEINYLFRSAPLAPCGLCQLCNE